MVKKCLICHDLAPPHPGLPLSKRKKNNALVASAIHANPGHGEQHQMLKTVSKTVAFGVFLVQKRMFFLFVQFSYNLFTNLLTTVEALCNLGKVNPCTEHCRNYIHIKMGNSLL